MRRRAFVGTVLAGLLGCGGPSAKLPDTYPVSGKVTRGGRALTGGLVQLRSRTDAEMTASGEIGADGTFTLTTLVGPKKLPGAVAGPHEVTVIPPMGADQAVTPSTLPKHFVVEARDTNSLVIDLPGR